MKIKKKQKRVRASFHVETYKLKASPNTQRRIEGMVKITTNGIIGLEEIKRQSLMVCTVQTLPGTLCVCPVLGCETSLCSDCGLSPSPICFFSRWSRVVFHLSPLTHLLVSEAAAKFSQLTWNLYWFPANKKVEQWDFLYFNNLCPLLSRMVVYSQRCFLKNLCDLLRIE